MLNVKTGKEAANSSQASCAGQRSPESIFLSILFKKLEQADIPYAVMRNYTSLPYSAGGSDLDLIVPSKYGKQAKHVIYDAVKNAGGVPIGIAESIGFFKIYILGCLPDGSHSWWGLRVDVNVGLVFKGQPLINEDIVMPLEEQNGIIVLAHSFAGVLGVLKEVLNNALLALRYWPAAAEAVQHGWPHIEKILMPLGVDGLARLRTLLLSGGKTDEYRDECLTLRRTVLRHLFLRKPFSFLSRLFSYEWTKVRRFLSPPGVMIAFLGVDGSGKSTLIDAISPILKEATHNALFVQHLRPSFLPPLARLKGKRFVHEGPILNPHGLAPSGIFGSSLRLVYYTLDYILGYWLKIRPKIAKQPAVVLFDRYAYDMALDSRRFRIGLSSNLVWWFVRLVPSPDIIICLYGDPAVIVSRKKELPLREVKRQIEDLIDFAKCEKRAVLVSTAGTVEQTREDILFVLKEAIGCLHTGKTGG